MKNVYYLGVKNLFINGKSIESILEDIPLFYGTKYTIRPAKLLRNLRNIMAHKPESRFEMILEKAIYRHRKINCTNF